jgi:hypothetical protein
LQTSEYTKDESTNTDLKNLDDWIVLKVAPEKKASSD